MAQTKGTYHKATPGSCVGKAMQASRWRYSPSPDYVTNILQLARPIIIAGMIDGTMLASRLIKPKTPYF